MRKSFALLGVAVFLIGLFLLYGIWQNNREIDYPQQKEFERSLASGIKWLDNHRTEILDDANPMLWWMVKRSAELTGDKRLGNLYADYRGKYLGNARNAWLPLFDAKVRVSMQLWELEGLPDYNLLFLYGVSCNAELAKVQSVQAQQGVSFCDSKPFSPACVTHQMMGLMLMRDRGCGDQNEVNSAISKLQDKVVLQLTWDIRLVDVYIQRVLMLVDMGNSARVKPVWMQRVLDVQGSDGGWTSFQPIVPVWQNMALGFSGRGVGIEANQSNFHATAQGVLLMSLLLDRSRNMTQN